MAEFLIKAIDATHSDPIKDKSGSYKRGDVVVVMPDGWPWGRLEGPPKFVIVKIPGMSVEAAQKYIDSEKDISIPENPRTLTRRKYKFHIDDITLEVKSELDSKGTVVMTEIQAEGFLRDKTSEIIG
jgi:hypothetical protein